MNKHTKCETSVGEIINILKNDRQLLKFMEDIKSELESEITSNKVDKYTKKIKNLYPDKEFTWIGKKYKE